MTRAMLELPAVACTARHGTAVARTSRGRRMTPARIVATLVVTLGVALVGLSAGVAHGNGFLDDVAAGRAAAIASGADRAPDAGARSLALQDTLGRAATTSAGFTIGATLAVLDAELARGPARRGRADRALVEQQVRGLLAAQLEAGIGNRALCLLSGRADPKSLERQVRLVEPRWSCEHG